MGVAAAEMTTTIDVKFRAKKMKGDQIDPSLLLRSDL